MPEPPSVLSASEQARIAAVRTSASTMASAQASLPAADVQVSHARKAVSPPLQEREARAQGALVEALDQQPEPSPEIEALCERIRQAIRERRPPDEDSLVKARPDEMARAAGSAVGHDIQGEVDSVEGAYGDLQRDPAPASAGQREELPEAPRPASAPPLQAQRAVPEPVATASTSLDADAVARRQLLDDAGMSTAAAQLVRTGPIAKARDAQKELEQAATVDPPRLRSRETAVLDTARADMKRLEEVALEALRTSRKQTTQGIRAHQGTMVGSEEQQRARASARAQALFDEAQRRVDSLLQPLTDTAMRRWEAGIQRLSGEFKSHLRKVEQWIEERHSGALGWLVAGADSLFGLPKAVAEEYDKAERAFGDGACALARDISRQVNGVIASCEAIIQQARTDIAQVFSRLPASLQSWAAKEQARLGQQLDALRDSAHQQREQFDQQLVQRASQAVQEVRQEVHGLRQKAGGLVGRIGEAVQAFLRDPVRFLIEGLLELASIPPAAFWAVVERVRQALVFIARDPLGFAGNLLGAVGQGFRRFFDNIGGHLQRGLVEWLTSGLAGAGVQLPGELSLKGITTFFLQLMGITWERLRRLIARRLGERNVELIERAWESISTLVRQGPAGVFELIKAHLDPQRILDRVLTAARDAIMELVITRVAVRILLLFNPASAIVQAVEAIYRVLDWIFRNAARLFRLVEAVAGGIMDIVRGSLSGPARAVEQALAGLISPVISFFASYLGLGGLPQRIRGIIEQLQSWVEGLLDKVIGWIAQQLGRAVVAVRTAAGRVLQWWRQRKRFKARDGEQHSLYFQGEGRRAHLIVESTPKPFEDFIAELDPQSSEERRAKQRAIAIAQQMDTLRAKTAPDGSFSPEQWGQFQALWDELVAQVILVLGSAGKSTEPLYGGLTATEFGTAMLVLRLTKPSEGTRPTMSHRLWEELNLRRNRNGSYYILGHLLSEKLQGPGNTWKNLTPLSRTANANHLLRAEKRIKDAVNKEGRTMRYEVLVRYGRQRRDSLLNELAKMPPSARRDNLQNVIKAEQHIAVSLRVRAVEVDAQGKPKGSHGLQIADEIQNTIEDDSLTDYQVSGEPAKRLEVLGINDSIEKSKESRHKEALKALYGIGDQRVQELIDNGPYYRWEHLWEKNRGITREIVDDWRSGSSHRGFVIKLYGPTRWS